MTETAPETKATDAAFDAPEDAAEGVARGYAVYDRTLGRYVTGMTPDKPSAKDAKEAASGHVHSIVRV